MKSNIRYKFIPKSIVVHVWRDFVLDVLFGVPLINAIVWALLDSVARRILPLCGRGFSCVDGASLLSPSPGHPGREARRVVGAGAVCPRATPHAHPDSRMDVAPVVPDCGGSCASDRGGGFAQPFGVLGLAVRPSHRGRDRGATPQV